MTALDERQGAALTDAVAAYMGLMRSVSTETRPTQDNERVEAFSGELTNAVARYRARARVRQEAAEEAAEHA